MWPGFATHVELVSKVYRIFLLLAHIHIHTHSYIHINICIYEMHDLINLGLCVLMAMFRTVLNTRGVTVGI
jgi:hypothetical protein